MRINTNFPAKVAFTSLDRTNKSLQKTLQSLSTGLRINSSADDAAGFAVSQRMRAQLSGLDKAIKNAQDGLSLIDTAEGALGETNAMLQRMRELAVQASNDALTSTDRQYIQLEIDELRDQIDRIANTTQFNRKRILDGSSGAMWSSNDAGVKVRINGGLEYTDEYGNKVSSEGNYRIEVRAEPGQVQVQKSNIFNLDFVEETKRIEYVPVEDANTPAVIDDAVLDTIAERIEIENLTSGDSGNGWSFNGQQLVIEESGTYAITGTNQVLTDRSIKVSGTARATMFLSGVNISRYSGVAFELEKGASVDMYLSGDNYLQSGTYCAGIEAPKGTTLSISSISGYDSTDGTLEVHGGSYGAGIGASSCNMYEVLNIADITLSSGDIKISGGTIKAYGGREAAGIGGAYDGLSRGGGGEVTIIGGNIEAYGGVQGAGIGSGHWAGSNHDTIIKIAGGTVKAYGGEYGESLNGAGIGGACHSDSGTILIKEGLVQWLDKNNGVVAPNSYPVLAQKGSPGAANTAQDIGHGTDSDGRVGKLSELIDMPIIPAPSPASKRIPVVISDVSVKPSTLRSINAFYNSEGVFLVDRPKTITITQGNGKTAQVTLYESDSIYDVAERINNAISDNLGQGAYTNNTAKFCTIANGPENTSESVYAKEDVYRPKYQRDNAGNLVLDKNNNPIVIGREYSGKRLTFSTMLVRSAIPGHDGELHFSGDEDLLRALGLNTIQQASESTLTASVYDAHSGKVIASNAKASGPEFVSLIPPDIDIEVDPMPGLANWDESTKRFMLARKNVYTAFLHLKNNGTVFQTGANIGEDFTIKLADSSATALNLQRINVLTRETASRSINLIDRAIRSVSAQRAKLGAYTNALEHTTDNLTTASANLSAAESRIRDADMSRTMMDFVRLQILNQSGTSMLAQANQLPQSVMTLMGN